jgi:hypothetical protein
MDLIVRNVRLANGFPSEPADIGVAGGKIVAIERAWQPRREPMMRAGASPAPVWSKRTSILDKSRIIDRCPPERAAARPPL